jgi:hypothetical protein
VRAAKQDEQRDKSRFDQPACFPARCAPWALAHNIPENKIIMANMLPHRTTLPPWTFIDSGF